MDSTWHFGSRESAAWQGSVLLRFWLGVEFGVIQGYPVRAIRLEQGFSRILMWVVS